MTLDLYRLAPGDVLAIKVYREEDLSGRYRIDPDGTLNFPLLGRLAVAGQSADWTERMLEKRLSQGYLVDPDVQLSVAEFKPVYVGGAVSKTGEYPYKLGLTVQQAVTLAGGLNRFAAEKYYIQRFGESPEQRFRATADTPLYPGDVLTVDERIF